MKVKGLLAGALVIAGIALCAQNAEKKEWKMEIGEKNWTKDAVIVFKEGGFGLAENPDKKYGWVESKERLPYSKSGELSIDVAKLTGANITVQLQTFNDKGGFISAVNLLDEIKDVGRKTVSLDNVKVDPATATINFKIWIGCSDEKGSVEIKEFSFKN
jgi:hypothetical protein